MKIFNLIVLFLGICFFSCSDSASKSETTNNDSVTTMKMATDSNVITEAIDSTHSAQNSLDWQGTYKGILPSADYEGIETEIMLHSNNTYMISTKTLKPKTKSALYKEGMSDGKFIWVDGSTIQLEGQAKAQYFVAENKLIQLDSTGQRVAGSNGAKYILTKN